MLLDRFVDGDSTLNAPVSGAEKPADFQGGDLVGLLTKLKAGYFTGLGVNVLWLSSPAVAPDTKHLGQDRPLPHRLPRLLAQGAGQGRAAAG